MAKKRKVHRFAPYFQGWATAFGNHEKHVDEGRDLSWLLGKDQIGLIVTQKVKDFAAPVLAEEAGKEPPKIKIGSGVIQIGEDKVRFDEQDAPGFEAVMDMLKGPGDLYLLQTYHLVYPSGTRILTLTRQTPLPLVYREIKPLRMRLV